MRMHSPVLTPAWVSVGWLSAVAFTVFLIPLRKDTQESGLPDPLQDVTSRLGQECSQEEGGLGGGAGRMSLAIIMFFRFSIYCILLSYTYRDFLHPENKLDLITLQDG